LLDRVAASGGEAATFSERGVAQWAATDLARLQSEGLLVKGPPADTVICPGCEENCTMSVEIATTARGKLRAFVVCDRRDDVARVAIGRDLLEQWTCSPERVADVVARLLGTRRSDANALRRRWDVGILKGLKYSAHVVLCLEGTLKLAIAGHSLELADVLDLNESSLSLDRRALIRCVDNPIGAAGDKESAEQRRKRLVARVQEERTKKTPGFLKLVAAEEGITDTRLKQIIYKKESKAAGTWSGLRSTPKKPKSPS